MQAKKHDSKQTEGPTPVNRPLTDAEKVENERNKIKEGLMTFTGEAMSFVYRPHLGFADYAIVRFKIENGKVVSIEELSDPYAAFEARAHMETKQAYVLERMRRNYPGGHQHV